MRKIPLLLIITVLFACNKEQQEQKQISYRIAEQWEIVTENNLHREDGIIYNNEYLVFSDADDFSEVYIVSYDLKSKTKLWEYSLKDQSRFDKEIFIYEDYLVLHNPYLGISIFDLKQKALSFKLKFEAVSYSPPTYFNKKLYFVFQDHYHTKCIIKSINFNNWQVNDEYEWPAKDGLFIRLTSPLVYNDDEGENFVMQLQLYNKEEGEAFYGETFLMSINETHTLNWIDTIGNAGKSSFIKYLPVLKEKNVFVKYRENLVSYNMLTGEKNWQTQVAYNEKRLLLKDNFIYAENEPNRNYAKFDVNTGEMIWDIGLFLSRSNFNDFELYDNHIVLVKSGISIPFMFNNDSGNYLKIENNAEFRMANPKFYKSDSVFISHDYNRILGFKLEVVK